MPQPQIDSDDLPHREWECPYCGSLNSDFDAECQWCDWEETDWDAINTDHILDHRKHSK